MTQIDYFPCLIPMWNDDVTRGPVGWVLGSRTLIDGKRAYRGKPGVPIVFGREQDVQIAIQTLLEHGITSDHQIQQMRSDDLWRLLTLNLQW